MSQPNAGSSTDGNTLLAALRRWPPPPRPSGSSVLAAPRTTDLQHHDRCAAESHSTMASPEG
eukprot:1514817-Lingulodinium_polyedra.AAC.1